MSDATDKVKKCTKCGVDKGLGEFNKRNSANNKLRPDCRECQSKYRKQYQMQNKDRLKKCNLEYRLKNKRKTKLRMAAYYKNTSEKQKAASKEYYYKNKKKVAKRMVSTSARRRAAKIKRTPSWSDLEHIGQFYEARQAISEATGVEYHVDHMIPLQGEMVSGLHVPANLQIIRAEANLSKGNRY